LARSIDSCALEHVLAEIRETTRSGTRLAGTRAEGNTMNFEPTSPQVNAPAQRDDEATGDRGHADPTSIPPSGEQVISNRPGDEITAADNDEDEDEIDEDDEDDDDEDEDDEDDDDEDDEEEGDAE